MTLKSIKMDTWTSKCLLGDPLDPRITKNGVPGHPKWSLRVTKMTVVGRKSDPFQQSASQQWPVDRGAGGRGEALRYICTSKNRKAQECCNGNLQYELLNLSLESLSVSFSLPLYTCTALPKAITNVDVHWLSATLILTPFFMILPSLSCLRGQWAGSRLTSRCDHAKETPKGASPRGAQGSPQGLPKKHKNHKNTPLYSGLGN